MPEQSTVVKPKRSYGIGELAQLLDVPRRQLEHALAAEIVPAPDRYSRHQRRWTKACANRLRRNVPEIRACLPPAPDLEHLGAVRSAELIAARLGQDVFAYVLPELALLGHVPRAGTYKGYPLYDRRAVDTVDAHLVAAAAITGQLLMTDEAASYLRTRTVEIDHLVRAGFLTVASRAHSRHQRHRKFPTVRLFRRADLDDVNHNPDIDWAAVRKTPSGHRSPLAALASVR